MAQLASAPEHIIYGNNGMHTDSAGSGKGFVQLLLLPDKNSSLLPGSTDGE